MTQPEAASVDARASLRLLRGDAWPNRLVLAPMTNKQSHPDGTLSEDELHWLSRRAEGGFGVVMTCAAHVSHAGQAWIGQMAAWDDRFVPGLRQIPEAVSRYGRRSILQLYHGGRRAKSVVSGEPTLAPWADARTGSRRMTIEEIREAVDDFAAAARRAQDAGFDGVEVHAAHGYLIEQFLDSSRNTRDDEFGGDFEGRARFLRAVVERIRDLTDPDFQVGVRISPESDGIILEESQALAASMMASGLIDFLDLSLWDSFKYPRDSRFAERPLLEQFADLPRHGVRVGVAGKIYSGAAVQECLDRGADFVVVGTAAIVHHDFANRVMADPGFVSVAHPVSRDHYRQEGLNETFIDYLSNEWDDFVI